jgi:hypothetical protein
MNRGDMFNRPLGLLRLSFLAKPSQSPSAFKCPNAFLSSFVDHGLVHDMLGHFTTQRTFVQAKPSS